MRSSYGRHRYERWWKQGLAPQIGNNRVVVFRRPFVFVSDEQASGSLKVCNLLSIHMAEYWFCVIHAG